MFPMTPTPNSLPLASTPQHVGIIIDGNRRWAKLRGKSVLEGHARGYKALIAIAKAVYNRGIKELSAYVFSTENWQRSKQEVEDLMNLVRLILKNDVKQLHKNNIRVRVSGIKANLPPDILQLIQEAITQTKHNTKGVLNLCFNYGGRADIVEAVKKLVKAGKRPEEIDEKAFAGALSTAGMSDVDLVIRTSESRLSNFLPWESVYAELYFLLDKTWPDFTEQDLDEALNFYAARHRRFGT